MAVKAAEGWITSEDGRHSHHRQQGELHPRHLGKASAGTIAIDAKNAGHSILGFGGMFNDSAIYHFGRMNPTARQG
ncbi:MAG TPA: hypothetical protein VGC39_07205, partial [Candidatus Methylacidiphilales bacterium]